MLMGNLKKEIELKHRIVRYNKLYKTYTYAIFEKNNVQLLFYALEELNMNVTTCALNGGEDYELLFTVPIGDLATIESMPDVKLIGHITRPELGLALIARDGSEFELKAQGWNPLANNKK